MKKIIALFCICVSVAAASQAQASRGGTMYVAVRNLELKSSSGVFATASGVLEYGAQVTVAQISGDWAQVRAADGSAAGWARLSSLTARRISAQGSSGATAQEVALAGKGFDREIETANRAEIPNYDEVDRMEAQSTPLQELRNFLSEGRLAIPR